MLVISQTKGGVGGGGDRAAVALLLSQAERAHNMCVFSDQFNGVEPAAMSGMPLYTAVTSDGGDYKLWEKRDPLSSHSGKILRADLLIGNITGARGREAAGCLTCSYKVLQRPLTGLLSN